MISYTLDLPFIPQLNTSLYLGEDMGQNTIVAVEYELLTKEHYILLDKEEYVNHDNKDHILTIFKDYKEVLERAGARDITIK